MDIIMDNTKNTTFISNKVSRCNKTLGHLQGPQPQPSSAISTHILPQTLISYHQTKSRVMP